MDGVLVIDKPQGLTSHDVVAAARRALGEKRIGHTGTLDPLATGILPLAVGRATRLVRFLTASDKDYDATIRFGATTDSYDVTGNETRRTDLEPSRDALLAAIQALTGDYLQPPPPGVPVSLGECDGDPQGNIGGNVETGRHHPDDGCWVPVNLQGLFQHTRVAAEPALPVPVAEEHYVIGVGLRVLR